MLPSDTTFEEIAMFRTPKAQAPLSARQLERREVIQVVVKAAIVWPLLAATLALPFHGPGSRAKAHEAPSIASMAATPVR
jgi:hypothetical protein